jgi:hypothetical protein
MSPTHRPHRARSISAAAVPGATAWQGGRFVVDIRNLVRRSDIVLGKPNRTAIGPWEEFDDREGAFP